MSSRRNRALAVAGALVLALLATLLWRAAQPPQPAPPAPAALAPAPPPLPSLPFRLAPATPPAAVPPAPTGPGAFEGRVLSSGTGLAIPGAEITFSRAGAAASVRAGEGGAFRFQAPQPGRWRLAAATAPGFLPFAPAWEESPVELWVRPGERLAGIDVYLTPAPAYRGLVLLPDGQPAPGAEVRLLAGLSEAVLHPLPDRFTAGERGEFTFTAPDDAVLEARHPGYLPGRSAVDFGVRVSGRLTLRLGEATDEPPAREVISGVVLDPAGAPVEGAVVVGEFQRGPRSTELRAAAQAVTGGDGRFALRELDRGVYLVTAAREGYVPARAGRVRSGRDDLELRLALGGAIAGRVRDRRTGGPVPLFSVVVWRREGPLRIEAEKSLSFVDPAGRYQLSGLPPGRLLVSVLSPEHAPSAQVEVDVPPPPAPPAAVDFELASGGRLFGKVVELRSARPLEGARVEVEGLPQGASVLPLRAQGVADAAGAFALSGLPPHPLSVLVSAGGHHARILSGLRVPEEGELGPITVELAATAEGEEPRVELGGIGVALRPGREALRVVTVSPGGGAAEAGIQPGDEITTIDGRPVIEVGFTGAVELIRGPEGSTVVLRIRRGRGAAPLEVAVLRRLVRG